MSTLRVILLATATAISVPSYAQQLQFQTDPMPLYTGFIYPQCSHMTAFVPQCVLVQPGLSHCSWYQNQQFFICQQQAQQGLPPPPPPGFPPPPPNTGGGGGGGGGLQSYIGKDIKVWGARADITPCSRKKTYRDDFGLEWPTIETAGQEVYAEAMVRINSPNQILSAVQSRVEQCGITAAAVAGLTAYATSGSAAWPAFKASFTGCMQSAGYLQYLGNISLNSGSRCRW